MLSFILILSLLGLRSSAQIIQAGQCNPDINLFQNFNIENFLGDWFEVARSDHPLQSGDCSRLNFNRVDEVINIKNEAVNRNFFEEITGTVHQEGTTGRLTLDLLGFSDPVDFWVLNTDHNNYAITYKCVNVGESQRAVYVWLLSRQQTISELLQALINTSLNNLLGITMNDLRSIDFSDGACYELPVIDENQPIVLPGQCDPNIEVVQNFDVANFTGIWHEIASYYSEIANGTCARAEYSAEGATVAILNSQVVDQALEIISGTATVIAADGSGKLSVILEVAPGATTELELLVLATDYTDYAVFYSCVDLPNDEKRVYSWITSRTRQQTADAGVAVTQIVDSIVDLNALYYEPIDQSDDGCFYYPEPVEDQPLVFRGQCDLNIPAVANFDLERYTGIWHNIESYPFESQIGTCNNAEYTLDPTGVVNVLNTQVVNQSLDAINGNATIAEDANGTGKLVITFPNEDTGSSTTDYWVLDTDYDNYALVYTCYNINAEERAVWSWKLSRRKELSAAANNAINAVIDTIPVLDQRYFQTTDQSVNGCFYYPEAQPGVPVVFPGQCDNSLPAVSDFNLISFEGVWHEIEAYPKIEQPGDCINHALSEGTGNTLNVQSAQIIDLSLNVSTGSVAFSSTDGSGRLVITITANGEVIEIPYWILQTDYVDYALAYSCVNINEDFRGISSWKLSRSKELSAVADAAIDAAISSIEVLSNDYYEPVDQSESACFYLPDLEPGEGFVIPGQCQDIPVVQNFDLERYGGRWHLIATYPSDNQNGTCNDATYYPLQGGSLRLVNTQVVDETLVPREASAEPIADNEGKFLVTFSGAEPVEYWILDTDYDSYSLAYFCVNLTSDSRRIFTWKMSRTRELSATAVERMDEIIDSVNVLDNRYYEDIDNSDAGCFYYPSPDGNPVVFRGQCDENISVVTNFDVNKYTGIWYDIESYPQEFQEGTCATSTYTLTDDGIIVQNTQVIEELLDSINGTLISAGDDDVAKLIVTFPDSEAPIPYWILATDYDNYALVYSCRNIDEEYRSVWSWKLSRRKELSAAANNAINAVIDTIPVLDQRYFQTTDQSVNGCFYYPEAQPGVPVVFPGQCDNSLPAVSDFNLNSFEGVWHEIEAYPKIEQPGDCINHALSEGTGNTLNVQSAQIIDLSLNVSTGSVAFSSTDGSGRLVITITANGEVIEIPYWILQTDYVDYALAYSCVNINEDFRGISSWKLSRSKELSAVADAAIDAAISSIEVLSNDYYEPVDQSESACFYLPDLEPGEGFVIPGQCQDIPVVQNFDLERYGGRWHLIATYPSDNQNGTCNDATYYPLQGGSLRLVNTQVVDETLVPREASAEPIADNEGKFLVTFSGAEPVEYWILDTDYDSYSLAYFCVNLTSDSRRIFTWKMSRTRELSATAVERMDAIIDSVNVLDNRYYEEIDNSDAGCFYYPSPDGNPVVFRGQCDENISVVTNFDVNKYTGIWYEIESYPREFLEGTCATSTYTLTEDGIIVQNTQVIEELLDSYNGTSVSAGDDDVGKFIVTFPDIEAPIPYWILATDYDNYALVYSCRNIDEEHRSVTSRKLSRQRELTAESAASIDSVISTVQVLSSQYYDPLGHTERDCFYYPDNFGGPVVLNGQCQEQTVVENFNLNQFAGTWHEAARFPSNEQTGECTTNELVINQNSFILTQTIVYNERLTTVSGPATVADDGRGIITATLQNADGVSIETTLYVLDTDYTDYALLFSCVDVNEEQKQVYSWKLARTRAGLSESANNKIDEVVGSNVDLHETYYEYTDQTNDGCFYYPVFEEPPPVIVLPGPCDDRIQGIPNFNVNAYLGRWFEISKYPQRDQDGECSRAYYSDGQGDAVDVRNTIVYNQTLETREGTATLASSDGSGHLTVTYVLDDEVVPADYYVLATDYTDYALIYSCSDLDNGDSEVYSWKLSRQPSLSNAANHIINNVISNTRGLLEDYYEPTSQTAEDCFYVPEPNPDEAVLFRGECEGLTGMAGFDMAQYVGWWHELEHYPSGDDVGECISSQYSSSGAGYQVVDTNVFDLTGQVSTGSVVASPNGMLMRTLSNGQTQVIWVLDTDYETYSLLYSCTPTEDGEYRRVWSAKHSKQRELSEAAQAAMEPVIASNEVLYEDLYQPVEQSDAACFHYPPAGELVVLPGQCDASIPTVQNFDPVQYTGTWYLVEQYPHPEAGGTCVGARYQYDVDTQIVSVLNWYMDDGALHTTEGSAVVDGAKITVTLPVEGSNDTITRELYILHSDYVTYSLVYTCTNVDQFQRAVVAFKFSRTTDLPDSAVASIDDYMSSREELHQEYFVSVEHEDCLDPSSALLIKSSSIIMLVCVALQLFV